MSDRLHRGGDHGEAGEPGAGRVQPHGGLRDVPGRGHDLAVLLGREERQQEAVVVAGPQRLCQVDGSLAHPGRLLVLLR